MATASPAARSSRYRQLPSKSATPQPSGSNRDGRRGPANLPPYEQQVAELNPAAKRAVQTIVSNSTFRHLKDHLDHAGKALTDSAGNINDTLADALGRYEKGLRRRGEVRRGSSTAEGDGEGGGEVEGRIGSFEESVENEAAKNRVEDLERRVKKATKEMEEKIREVVDLGVRTDTLMDVLKQIGAEDEVAQNQRRNTRSRRRTRRGQADDDDEERSDDEESPEENFDEEPAVSAIQTLEQTLEEKKRSWETLSLTQRYTSHNSYVNFYCVVHDAKNPGANNTTRPLPHPSTWFSRMEERPTQSQAQAEAAPSPRSTRTNKRKHPRRQADEDDGELEIDSERISLKCPITLLSLKDPVTSTKCPHSFEREAIEQMIRNNGSNAVSRSSGQRRKHVQCPICTVQLSLDDLKSDPVLARRVRRANEIAAREDEDGGGADDSDDEDEDVMLEIEGRKKRRNVEVKQERVRSPSRIPDTQIEEATEEDEDEEDSELSAAGQDDDEDDDE